MISYLEDISTASVEDIGEEIFNLRTLQSQGMEVIDTLVLTNKLFYLFKNNLSIDNNVIYKILGYLSSELFINNDYVFIQSSLKEKCIGIIPYIKVEKNFTSLKYSIEKIYRSWFEEKAMAYRISHKLKDEDTFPALFIQPYLKDIKTITTRSCTTGELICRSNYSDNAQCNIKEFDNAYENYLNKIDYGIRKPSKIFFIKDNGIKICKIKEQVMTNTAYLICIGDYYKRGIIDKIEFIMRLEPKNICKKLGYKYHFDNSISQLKGLPTSPGISTGKIILRNYEFKKNIDNGLILLIDEATGEDIELIRASIGVIATRGGMTSHAACICRGMHIPSISTSSICFDNKKRSVYVNGVEINELTNVYIDGITGEAVFFKGDYYYEDNYVSIENKSVLDTVYEILRQTTDNYNLFKELSVDKQLHFSELKNHFKKIGYVS